MMAHPLALQLRNLQSLVESSASKETPPTPAVLPIQPPATNGKPLPAAG